jgi:16S rRNA G527 N7-methylase RsmG
MVLALVRPDREWHLLEPRQKRAAFLEEIVRELDLTNVEVLPLTAEAAAREEWLATSHVFAAARALAAPQQSLDLLVPLLTKGGTAAIFLGKTAPMPLDAEEWEPGIAIWNRARRSR